MVVVDGKTSVFKVKLFYDEDGDCKFLGTFGNEIPDSTVNCPLKQLAILHLIYLNMLIYSLILGPCVRRTYALLGLLSSRFVSKSRV